MGELSNLPNIGKVIERQLIEAGIETADQLRAIGSRAAWLRIQMNDPSACLMRLYGLQGAIQGARWKALPEKTRAELKEFYIAHRL